MGWIEKERPTPFDNQPIPGLLFLNGDAIAHSKESGLAVSWAEQYKGLKYPVIVFPSGVEASVITEEPDQPIKVAILREMRLPVIDTRDSAYEQAQALLESDWRAEKHDDNHLDLWLDKPDDSYLRITYDNEQRLMTDMKFVDTEAALTPDEILLLKDAMLEQFRQLPPEHQAAFALALLRQVVSTDMGEWMLDAVATLYLYPPEPDEQMLITPIVTRQHLEELAFPQEQFASLTDNDLDEITHRMREHYMDKTFWDELHSQVKQLLAQKHSPSSSQPSSTS